MKNKNIPFILFAILIVITFLFSPKDFYFIFNCALMGVTLLMVFLITKKLKVPSYITNTILAFMFCSMYVGKIFNIYHLIPFWDKILHFASGFFIAMIGNFLFDLMNKDNQNKLLRVAFCFIFCVACAAFWEIFEYSSDVILNTNNQGNSIHDTMQDIIYGTLSGGIASTILWIKKSYIKK